MFRSVRRYLDEAALDEPVVCYQGAAVVDPRTGEFLLHEPIDARGRARGDRGARVARHLAERATSTTSSTSRARREYSRRYAAFQRLPVVEVGRPRSRGSRARRRSSSVVAEPPVLADIRGGLEERFGGSHVPHDVAAVHARAGESRGDEGIGPRVRRRAELGLDLDRVIAFGDGENDVELLEVGRLRRSPSRARTRVCARSPTGRAPGRTTRASRASIDRVLDSLGVIDLKAARADPDALARGARAQGRGGGLRPPARGRRALARARPARRRAARRRRSSRASRRRSSSRSCKAVKAELKAAEEELAAAEAERDAALARGPEPPARRRARRRHRGRRRRAPPRRRAADARRRRASTRRSAASTWSAPRACPARASATSSATPRSLALALYRFALDHARRARASRRCSRRCSCARRRCTAPASSPPSARTSTRSRRTTST